MSYPDLFSTAPREAAEPSGRRRHNPRADEVWNDARLEYASGYAAEEVCRVYGLALSTFKARARVEGWRRKDMTVMDAQKLRDESDIAPPPAPPTPELVELAWRLMAEAAQAGKANETKFWLKVWQTLTSVAEKTNREGDVEAFTAKFLAMSPSLEKRASRLPAPLRGEGLGMGVAGVQQASSPLGTSTAGVTPTPGLSPSRGRGEDQLRSLPF